MLQELRAKRDVRALALHFYPDVPPDQRGDFDNEINLRTWYENDPCIEFSGTRMATVRRDAVDSASNDEERLFLRIAAALGHF